jgi:hypothetical protein
MATGVTGLRFPGATRVLAKAVGSCVGIFIGRAANVGRQVAVVTESSVTTKLGKLIPRERRIQGLKSRLSTRAEK